MSKHRHNPFALRRATMQLDFWETELDCAKMDGERTDLIEKNVAKYRAEVAELKQERGISQDVVITY